MRVSVLILCAIAAVQAGPIAQEDSVLRVFVNNFVNCMNSDINLCLKEHALKATERLSAARKLDLIEGVTLINNEPREAKSLDVLSSDPEERNKQVTERLWTTATDLLRKSDLELSYGGDDIVDEKESRAIDDAEESRGKKKKIKKKLKMLLPLAILGKIKAIILIVGALLVIAASVFKIALLAKIAFIAKVIAIAKALLWKKSSHHEEVWASPVYEEHGHTSHGSGWEGGWSRSRNDGNTLAYSAYNQ